MTTVSISRIWKLVYLGLCALVMASSAIVPASQVSRTAGVDNSRMGAYKALADLAFQAFKHGDYETAAKLARILERTWDQGEWHNDGDESFCRDNRSVCQPIDQALDAFIGPIIEATSKPRDLQEVQPTYEDLLAKLSKAD